MKEHGIFPKGFVDWMIDICEQSAFQFLPGDGIIPGGLRRFYDNGTEKAVYIGSFSLLVASAISWKRNTPSRTAPHPNR